MGVEEDSIHIGVELGGNILGKELHLVDHIALLSGSKDFLLCFIIWFAGISYISWLNFGNVEAGSESVG